MKSILLAVPTPTIPMLHEYVALGIPDRMLFIIVSVVLPLGEGKQRSFVERNGE
jgi:hypothetical protein